MNVKDIAKRMDKKKVYRWAINPFGRYHLYGETGRTIYSTAEKFEAEIVTKKLRGMGMNIVGNIPFEMDMSLL